MHPILIILHIVWAIGIWKHLEQTEHMSAIMAALMWPLLLTWRGLVGFGTSVLEIQSRFQHRNSGDLF